MRIALLHDAVGDGARPDERDTLAQAAFVAATLAERGHEVEMWPVDLDLAKTARELREQRPEAVWNGVEALDGDARLIPWVPGLLEHLGLPFTGASSLALTLTSDKLLAKRRMREAGIPTPAWREAGCSQRPGPAQALHAPSGSGLGVTAPHARWILKPVWEDASVGIDDDAVRRGPVRELLAGAGEGRFAEHFVEGREFNLSLLEGPQGVEVLPVAEIRFEDFPPGKPRIVGYAAKWEPDSFESRHTPRSFLRGAEDERLVSALAELSRACWRVFGLRGYARVDFRVDEQGAPWVLEVNANPCLAPEAGFLAAAAQAGLGAGDVLERILAATS